MEFRPIKKLNGTRAPQKGTLEWNDFIHLPFAKLDMIECTCFHQHKPLLYLVTKDAQMYVFDTLTKLLQCRTTYEGLVSPGAHRPVKVMQTHRFLCLAFENGELVCWDSETMALLHVHRPEKELSKKPVSVCCEGTADPIVVIANQGEQRVTILDLETFTTAKERAGGKKSIAGMCMHPTQSVLAMCCTDGEIRLWDYRTETLITSVEGAIPPSHKYFLAFDSTGEHFIVSTPTGDICVWGPQQQQQQHHQQTPQATTAGKGTDERGNTLSFYCSASLNCACEGLAFVPQNTGVPLVLTAAQGAVAGWDLVRPGSPRTPALQPSLRLRGFSLRDEAAKYAGVCPLCVPVPEGQQEPAVKTCDFVVHRNRNAVVCLPYTGFETALGANVCLYKLTVASRHLHQRCAPLAPVAQDAAVWGADATHSNCGFSFPTNAVLFLNEQNLWAYSLQSEKGFRAKQLKQPPRGPGQEASSVPVGVRASYARDATFVLWETRTTTTATEASPQSNASHLYSMIKEGKQLGVFLPGTDIAFCGDNDESYVALQEDCHTLDVGSTAGDLAGVARYELDTSLHITRVFGAPTGSAILALNCCDGEDGGNEVLLLRKDDGFIAAPDGPRLALGPGVLATQVTWQTSESGPLGALLTSDRRVVVVDQDLNVLHTFDHSSRTGEITSVFWVGYALLCTSGSQVKALYLDGTENICGVLSDRIIFGSCSLLTTTVYSRPVSLFEPLIIAELAYSIHFRAEPRTTSELEERVRQLLAHFEWQRVTPALVYRLLAAGLTEVSIILASSPAAFSTNATQIDAHVVHRPNDPQILCTTGDQTPFSECLQGETCNIANSSLSEIAAKTYYTQKEDPGKPGISARTMEAADELLTKAPVSVGLLGVGYEAMDTVGLDVIAKYMSSLSSTKCQVQKTSVSLGSRLSTTVADKPVGKLMWVDGADTTFPLSTLDNKSGFGGNYFNTTGTGANPKTRPVIKTRPCGTFCMEKSLDELCLESADDVGFVKKANLDVDLSIFDRPLVDESQNTVTEFENDDDDDDDCDSGDASVIKDVSPVYKAKYTRKTTMQAETIFATGAYSKATRRPLDREVISLVHSRHPPPPTPRSRKPNAKLPTPPKEQKGAPAQAKKEPEHSNKPPAPESPQGAEKSSETKEPKKEESEKPTRPAPPTRKPPPPPSSGKGVLHRKPSSPATPKKTPNASAEGAATPEKLKKVTVGQQGTPTAASVATPRRAPPPPVPGLKLQQKAAPASPSQSPQQEAPGTPKTAPAAHELTTPKTGPKGTGTPTSARRLPPMQKTSPSAMRRAPVPPSKTQQPRPAPSRPVPKMSPTAEAVIGTTEYQEARAATIQAWNKRQYDACLKLLDPLIKKVAEKFATCMEDSAMDRELHQLISYKSAIYILKRIMSMDKSNLAEIALYTKMLTDLMLHAQHRVDCIRLAVAKNMEAENFGTAAKLIQAVLPLNLPDKKDMEEKLEVCKIQKFSEKNVLLYPCPGCGKQTPTIVPECKCGTPVKFSCKTFELLKGPVIMKCSVCDALFNKDDSDSPKCTYCGVGNLCEFNVEEAAKKAMTSKS